MKCLDFSADASSWFLIFFLHYAVAAAWQQCESSKIEIHQKIDTYLIDHNEVSPQTKQFWKEAFLWFLSSNSPELLNNLRLNFKILCLLCSILNVIHFNAETVFLPIHPCSVLAAHCRVNQNLTLLLNHWLNTLAPILVNKCLSTLPKDDM